MNELLLPGSILSSRTRVRLDGSSVTKITLDKADQHFLEERVPAIKAAFKKLASKDIEIDFQKEPTYYVLKKGERRWFDCSLYSLFNFHSITFLLIDNSIIQSGYFLYDFQLNVKFE